MIGRRALSLLPLGVCALTFMVFLPALQASFVNWDDPANFLSNPHYRGLGWTRLKWMFTTTLLGHYIPLTWMTLGLNYVLGGMEPWGYHLGNLLLHGGNAALFYLVARRLLVAGFRPGAPSPRGGEGRGEGAIAIACGAAVAALIFGVHPLRAESVAWVTERRDIVCGWFYLLAVLAYLKAEAGNGTARGGWRTASLIAFGAALLSKAIAMTLPLSLLVLDAYPLRRWGAGWRVLVREKVPYLVMAALGAIIAATAVTRGAVWTSYEAYGLPARAAMVGYNLWFYPSKFVWAEGLSPLYELPARVDLLEWRFLGPALAAGLVTIVLVLLRRAWPAGLAAWAHSAIVLAPVSGVVHAGFQLAHDRYSYLSGLGFALLSGAGVTAVLRAWRRERLRGWLTSLAVGAAVLVVAGWGAGAWRQSKTWRDSETLWRAALSVDGDCALCRNNLGIAIVRAPGLDPRRLREAEEHFRDAIRLRPERSDPYYNLGSLLASQKRYEEAEPVMRRYMVAFPGLSDGPERLGMLYRDEGRVAEAIPLLRQALRMKSDSASLRVELARALTEQGLKLVTQGRTAEAAELFRESSELQPETVEPLRNLGQTVVEQGKR